MREQNSKSALGGKSSQSLIGGPGNASHQTSVQTQGASGGNNNSLKRREKGRLIMQEWLSKSGQNTGAASQQQFQGLEQAQMMMAHQNMNQS